MARNIEIPVGLTQEAVNAFAVFFGSIDAELLSRNFRKLYFEFLETEDCAEKEYFQDIAHEMNALFKLLDVMQDEISA